MSELSAGNTKLVQYLNEAYGTEMRLETALQAHISMTENSKYRQRLKEHLTETRRHGREVKQRIKRLGGTAQVVATPGPDIVSDAAGALIGGAERAVALAQGPLHAVRGTGEAEKQLKNAKTEYTSEAEEIATYSAIETLADILGDTETRQLARSIRREEERMLSFLEREINNQTKAVARAEIPSAERRSSSRKRSGGRKTKATAGTKAASTGNSSGRKASSGRKKATASTKRTSSGKSAGTSGSRKAGARRSSGAGGSAAKASARRRSASSSRRSEPRAQGGSSGSTTRTAARRATANR